MSGQGMSGQCYALVEDVTFAGPGDASEDNAEDHREDGRSRRAPAHGGQVAPSGAPAESEPVVARRLRARGLVNGQTPAQIAAVIRDECGRDFGTTWIRARRLALGITLADVVEQVRAWYEAEGRDQPRFSEIGRASCRERV